MYNQLILPLAYQGQELKFEVEVKNNIDDPDHDSLSNANIFIGERDAFDCYFSGWKLIGTFS